MCMRSSRPLPRMIAAAAGYRLSCRSPRSGRADRSSSRKRRCAGRTRSLRRICSCGRVGRWHRRSLCSSTSPGTGRASGGQTSSSTAGSPDSSTRASPPARSCGGCFALPAHPYTHQSQSWVRAVAPGGKAAGSVATAMAAPLAARSAQVGTPVVARGTGKWSRPDLP